MNRVSVFLMLFMLSLAVSARASAPQPARAVAAALYSGQWFEIARVPNLRQMDCQAGSFTFTGWTAGEFSVIQTCHHGSPAGPASTATAKARILPGTQNTKFKMSLLGGLISQDYWILDHGDDDLWAIMATPGGRYVWLVSRHPTLDPPTRARVLARIKALGYDLSRLVFPAQNARPAG
jgi:apolipoprotein D and lipocalin family protein